VFFGVFDFFGKTPHMTYIITAQLVNSVGDWEFGRPAKIANSLPFPSEFGVSAFWAHVTEKSRTSHKTILKPSRPHRSTTYRCGLLLQTE